MSQSESDPNLLIHWKGLVSADSHRIKSKYETPSHSRRETNLSSNI